MAITSKGRNFLHRVLEEQRDILSVRPDDRDAMIKFVTATFYICIDKGITFSFFQTAPFAEEALFYLEKLFDFVQKNTNEEEKGKRGERYKICDFVFYISNEIVYQTSMYKRLSLSLLELATKAAEILTNDYGADLDLQGKREVRDVYAKNISLADGDNLSDIDLGRFYNIHPIEWRKDYPAEFIEIQAGMAVADCYDTNEEATLEELADIYFEAKLEALKAIYDFVDGVNDYDYKKLFLGNYRYFNEYLNDKKCFDQLVDIDFDGDIYALTQSIYDDMVECFENTAQSCDDDNQIIGSRILKKLNILKKNSNGISEEYLVAVRQICYTILPAFVRLRPYVQAFCEIFFNTEATVGKGIVKVMEKWKSVYDNGEYLEWDNNADYHKIIELSKKNLEGLRAREIDWLCNLEYTYEAKLSKGEIKKETTRQEFTDNRKKVKGAIELILGAALAALAVAVNVGFAFLFDGLFEYFTTASKFWIYAILFVTAICGLVSSAFVPEDCYRNQLPTRPSVINFISFIVFSASCSVFLHYATWFGDTRGLLIEHIIILGVCLLIFAIFKTSIFCITLLLIASFVLCDGVLNFFDKFIAFVILFKMFRRAELTQAELSIFIAKKLERGSYPFQTFMFCKMKDKFKTKYVTSISNVLVFGHKVPYEKAVSDDYVVYYVGGMMSDDAGCGDDGGDSDGGGDGDGGDCGGDGGGDCGGGD